MKSKYAFEHDVSQARLGGPGPKMVMSVLARYAGLDERGKWSCFPSQTRIAYEAELKDRQVRRILSEFEQSGLIERTPRVRHKGAGPGRASHLITLNWGAIKARAEVPGPEVHDMEEPPIHADKMSSYSPLQPDIETPLTGHRSHLQPDICDTSNRTLVDRAPYVKKCPVEQPCREEQPDLENTHPQPPTATPPCACSDRFDEFYAAYPRHCARGAAEKAWARVTKTVDPDLIIAAARSYGTDPNLPEMRYVPYPASWLGNKGWADDRLPPSPQRTNGKPATNQDRNMDILLDEWRNASE